MSEEKLREIADIILTDEEYREHPPWVALSRELVNAAAMLRLLRRRAEGAKRDYRSLRDRFPCDGSCAPQECVCPDGDYDPQEIFTLRSRAEQGETALESFRDTQYEVEEALDEAGVPAIAGSMMLSVIARVETVIAERDAARAEVERLRGVMVQVHGLIEEDIGDTDPDDPDDPLLHAAQLIAQIVPPPWDQHTALAGEASGDGEAFCACGRRVSECDGSRAACLTPEKASQP